jgi:hypothetical protein
MATNTYFLPMLIHTFFPAILPVLDPSVLMRTTNERYARIQESTKIFSFHSHFNSRRSLRHAVRV